MPEGEAQVVVEFVKTVKYFTVVFKNWDGTVLKTEQVEEGKAATAPENPSRAADEDYTYSFKGWDKEFASVTENLEITAEFEATPIVRHTVVFVFNNGQANEELVVLDGVVLEEPEMPERVGYDFTKWFTDEELTEEFEFGTEVKFDITLYAGWERIVINAASSFKSGTGTEEDPFIIATASQLAYINVFMQAGNSGYYYYKLERDIDLEYAEWTPIGISDSRLQQIFPFYGSFDGNGHKIKNLMITEAERNYIGLFGVTMNYEISRCDASEIKNLELTDVNIDVVLRSDYQDWVGVGAFAGNLGGCSLVNCRANGSIKVDASKATRSRINVGGMYGLDFCEDRDEFIIEKCVCEVNVDLVCNNAANISAGSFAGYPECPTIKDCYTANNKFNVTFGIPADSTGYNVTLGGFAGMAMANMINCYTATEMTVTVNVAEGLILPQGSLAWLELGGFLGNGEDSFLENYGVIGGSMTVSGLTDDNFENLGLAVDKLVASRAYGENNFVYSGYAITGAPEGAFGKNNSAQDKGMIFLYDAAELNKEFFVAHGWSEDVWNFDNIDIEKGVYPTLK